MLQVHIEGKAIVSSGTREAMERDVTAMHEYGLWATLDKADELRPTAVRKFSRKRGMITTELSAYEVELLSSLIKQLVELVSDGEPEDFVPVRQPQRSLRATGAGSRGRARRARGARRIRC